MTNHPNRNPRKYLVTTISDGPKGLNFSKIGSELTRREAFEIAKKAAGADPGFTSHYGPDAAAYVGSDVTAVISWTA